MKLLTNKQYRQETADRHKSLQDQAKRYQAKAAAARGALKGATQEHENLVHQLNTRIKKLENQIETLKIERDVLKEHQSDAFEVERLTIKLEQREKLLKAREDAAKDIDEELKTLNKLADEAREEGIKKGYADGVADGLREATKITADDRRMMAQIAALAAASHTPEAASKLAEQVLTDVTKQLSTGK